MIALSPRAVERLESYIPPWPLPKLFRLTKDGALNDEIFEGATINTPSMLCVEDHLDGLVWAESIGGLPTLMARADANLWRAQGLGEAHRLGGFPRRGGERALQHLGVPEDRRSRGREHGRRRPRCGCPGHRACWPKRAWPTTSPPTATRRRACASGPARRWKGRSEALTPWLDWAFRDRQAAPRRGRLSRCAARTPRPTSPRKRRHARMTEAEFIEIAAANLGQPAGRIPRRDRQSRHAGAGLRRPRHAARARH